MTVGAAAEDTRGIAEHEEEKRQAQLSFRVCFQISMRIDMEPPLSLLPLKWGIFNWRMGWLGKQRLKKVVEWERGL